jgi:hypothetical protein
LFVREIAVAEDLAEQTGADGFAGVDGHGCDPAIGMSQAMMAALGVATGVEGEIPGHSTLLIVKSVDVTFRPVSRTKRLDKLLGHYIKLRCFNFITTGE